MKKLFFLGILMILSGCLTPQSKNKKFTPEVAREQAFQAWNDTLPEILKKIVPPVFKDTVYLISDTLNFREKLNTTIQEASQNGGGVVKILPGTYFVKGPVRMKSDVNLKLSEGAQLVFSAHPDDYLPVVKTRWEGTFCLNYSPLIYALGEKNIAITGKGSIDGQAASFFHSWKQKQKNDKKRLRKMGNDQIPLEERVFGKGHFLRPSGIEFIECRNILLEDFQIKESPFWTIHPVLSENITIRKLRIDTGTTNDDGIDPDSCKNVLIENCHITTHDDCVAIKAGRDQDGWQYPGSSNIVVRNNTFRTKVGSGFCIGSEMSGGVHNIFVENNTIVSNKHAFNFKSNPDRGGFMRHLYMRNMQIDSARYGLAFTTDYKGWRGNNYPTAYSDFFIENITFNSVGEIPVSITGLAQKPIERVYIHRLTVKKTDSALKKIHTKDVLLDHVIINGEKIDP